MRLDSSGLPVDFPKRQLSRARTSACNLRDRAIIPDE